MVPDQSQGREAIVKGDFHLLDGDPEALIDRDLSEWDIVYAEGRDPIYSMEDSKFGFGYYTIGALIMMNFHVFILKLFDYIGLSSSVVLEKADIKLYKRIDATHRKIWEFNSKWARWALIILASWASLATLIPSVGLDHINESPTVQQRILIFFPIIPAMFFLLSVINPTNTNLRNQYMARSINEHATTENHDKILVLVGELHRDGVGATLQDLGWEVDSRPTESRFGRWLSHAHRFVSNHAFFKQ